MSVVMRLKKILSWLFLFTNIILCVILLRIWLLSFDNKTSVDNNIAKTGEAELGMDAYCIKNPFAIFVDKEYSQNGNFYFCQYGNPYIFLRLSDNVSHTDAKKRLMFNLGIDPYICVNCYYSVENGCHIYDIQINKDGESFMDFNAEGRFNSHVIFWPKEKLRLDVWYKGKWQEVDQEKSEGMGKHQKVLKDNGEVVLFDKQAGQWIPNTDKHE